MLAVFLFSLCSQPKAISSDHPLVILINLLCSAGSGLVSLIHYVASDVVNERSHVSLISREFHLHLRSIPSPTMFSDLSTLRLSLNTYRSGDVCFFDMTWDWCISSLPPSCQFESPNLHTTRLVILNHYSLTADKPNRFALKTLCHDFRNQLTKLTAPKSWIKLYTLMNRRVWLINIFCT